MLALPERQSVIRGGDAVSSAQMTRARMASRSRSALAAVLLAGALASCSSTSQDPRAAYWAAFGQEIPAGVSVVRADLWENRHLFVFYEFSSTLELSMSDEALRRAMVGTGLTFETFTPNNYGFGPTIPSWFAPKGRKYEGWRSMPNGVLYLVREVGSDRVFAHRAEY
jgi:hypothetical protein